MGQYAIQHEATAHAIDLFTVDEDFDEPDSSWSDRAELLYAVNESAIAWRSQFPLESLDTDY